MPLPPSRAPRRRFDEPVAPVAPPEVERVLPAPMAQAPLTTETASEEVGIGAGDLGPRRRRRRGGRGRRAGLGGDADIQAESFQERLDDTDEGDGTEVDRSTAAASVSSPDDIDNAVLQLLASRDRDTTLPTVDEESPAETAVAPDLSSPVPVPTADPTPPSPRRIARTSFSSFGPPDVPLRPTTPASTSEETEASAVAEADSVSGRDEETPADNISTPTYDSVTQGLAPDAVVTEAIHVDPVGDAAFPQLAPVTADETEEVAGIDQPDAVTSNGDSGRPARSGRTTRSGTTRRTRRPAGGSADPSSGSTGTASSAGAASAEGASESGDADSRAPRRRRVRRPTPSSAAVASEAVTSEAGA